MEATGALPPGVWNSFLTCLQECRRGEGSHQALVGPLPSMHQAVLLQVGELGEAFLAQGTLKRALPTVHTQMDLSQVWEKCCQQPRAPAGPGVLSEPLPTSPQELILASRPLSPLSSLSLPP